MFKIDPAEIERLNRRDTLQAWEVVKNFSAKIANANIVNGVTLIIMNDSNEWSFRAELNKNNARIIAIEIGERIDSIEVSLKESPIKRYHQVLSFLNRFCGLSEER